MSVKRHVVSKVVEDVMLLQRRIAIDSDSRGKRAGHDCRYVGGKRSIAHTFQDTTGMRFTASESESEGGSEAKADSAWPWQLKKQRERAAAQKGPHSDSSGTICGVVGGGEQRETQEAVGIRVNERRTLRATAREMRLPVAVKGDVERLGAAVDEQKGRDRGDLLFPCRVVELSPLRLELIDDEGADEENE